MLVLIRNHKLNPKSLLTMIQLMWETREWTVNKREIFHMFTVSLKFLLHGEFVNRYSTLIHMLSTELSE
jgi:hypothetical protein